MNLVMVRCAIIKFIYLAQIYLYQIFSAIFWLLSRLTCYYNDK